MSNPTNDDLGKPLAGWRLRLYTVIFEADTRAGRLFDQWLPVAIVAIFWLGLLPTQVLDFAQASIATIF